MYLTHAHAMGMSMHWPASGAAPFLDVHTYKGAGAVLLQSLLHELITLCVHLV